MKSSLLFLLTFAVLAGITHAQLTLANSAANAPNPFITTIGTVISVDTTTAPPFGAGPANPGILARGNAVANAAYIPTGWGLNQPLGWTLQFWYQRTTAMTGNPDYIFGDGAMVAPAAAAFNGGAFRCFAGGVAGIGNIILRGVANQVISVGAPFAAINTWNHVAFRYTPPVGPTAGTIDLLVNGILNVSVAQITVGAVPATWSGSNLTILGYNNSTAADPPFFMDDIRGYAFARSTADILADFNLPAAGVGPSTNPNLPDRVYIRGDGSITPHIQQIATNMDAFATGQRITGPNGLMEWVTDSATLPTTPYSTFLNVNGPVVGGMATNPYTNALRTPTALPVSYTTSGVPGFELGHGFSTPANSLAIIWPDGFNVASFLPGIASIVFAIPATYGSGPTQFLLPPGIFNHGDRIDLQSVAVDSGWPVGLGISNRCQFVYADCGLVNPGSHARIEARGVGAIQIAGFFEIHNNGTVDIQSVTIDLATATGGAFGFNPNNALNTGGQLSLGTSYRYNSPAYTGLTNLPAGYTGGPAVTSTGVILTGTSSLTFNFTNFTACVDIFAFDCDVFNATGVASLPGNSLVGATVTVVFATGTLMGTMIVDPMDPLAAILDI